MKNSLNEYINNNNNNKYFLIWDYNKTVWFWRIEEMGGNIRRSEEVGGGDIRRFCRLGLSVVAVSATTLCLSLEALE